MGVTELSPSIHPQQVRSIMYLCCFFSGNQVPSIWSSLYYRSCTFLFFGPIFLVYSFNVGWYGLYVLRVTFVVKSELYLSANLQK